MDRLVPRALTLILSVFPLYTHDEFADIEKLHTLTGSPVPTQIAALAQKRVRFGESCTRDRVLEFVLGQLGC